MNRKFLILVVASAIGAAGTSFAQDKKAAAPEKKPAVAGAMEYAKVTATVEAIDQKTREVTLKGEGGAVVSFVAGPDVKNLAQVSKGDIVTIEYAHALLVGLEKSKSTTRGRVVTEGGTTATPGKMPGATAMRDVSVVASIEGIDQAKGTVTLRGPERTVTVKVRDPEKLKNFKVGDFVDASYTEALAVKVEKGPAPKK